jgi:cytochrome c oxidase assembly factor CtaG
MAMMDHSIMGHSVMELFTDWNIPPAVSCALALVATVYTVGWASARRTRLRSGPNSKPDQLPFWRLAAFLSGIFALFVAVASPLDTFSESLLFMHMSQHFVLMSVAPPLIVLGAPVVPLLRGLPRWILRWGFAPLFRHRSLHHFAGFCTRPAVAWIVMNVVYLGWHIPVAYEFALSSEGWHNFEHACFFFSSVLFWLPVIEPWPFRHRRSSWFVVPYLLLADLVNTGLSAFLCFAGRLIYPSYDQTPKPFGLSPLNDQIAAGALMWVLGPIIFVVPAAWAILVNLGTPGISSGRTLEHPSPSISPATQT